MANKIIQLSDGTNNLYPTTIYEETFTNTIDLDDIKRTTNAFCDQVVNSPSDTHQYGYFNSIFKSTGTNGIQIYREFYNVTTNIGFIYQREFVNNQWYPWHVIGGGYSETVLYIPTTQSSATVDIKQIKRYGKVVEVAFSGNNLVLTANQWNNVASINTVYVPYRAIDFFAVDNTNGVPLQARVTYDGNINIWLPSGNNTKNIRFTLTYIV